MTSHATPPTPDALDAAAIEATWLQQCGPCDAGLPMGCVCSDADPRPVIATLLAALDEARAEAADTMGGHRVARLHDSYSAQIAAAFEAEAAALARATAAEGPLRAVRALAKTWRDHAGDDRDVESITLRQVCDYLDALLAPVTTDETEGGGA